MSIEIDRTVTGDLAKTLRREWLDTNGIGGWASSSLAGAHTRRYHGLLVAATKPPVGRMVLLSKLEECLVVNGESFELACNRFPSAIFPQGYEYLASFSQDLYPVFEYEAGGVRLRKSVVTVHGENTTVVVYEVLEAPGPVELQLRPLVAGRDFHSVQRENKSINRKSDFRHGVLHVKPYSRTPDLYVMVPGSRFDAAPDWYLNFEYQIERYRGLDMFEDLFTYG
jgi:predicted glycogen debranching enzyme